MLTLRNIFFDSRLCEFLPEIMAKVPNADPDTYVRVDVLSGKFLRVYTQNLSFCDKFKILCHVGVYVTDGHVRDTQRFKDLLEQMTCTGDVPDVPDLNIGVSPFWLWRDLAVYLSNHRQEHLSHAIHRVFDIYDLIVIRSALVSSKLVDKGV